MNAARIVGNSASSSGRPDRRVIGPPFRPVKRAVISRGLALFASASPFSPIGVDRRVRNAASTSSKRAFRIRRSSPSSRTARMRAMNARPEEIRAAPTTRIVRFRTSLSRLLVLPARFRVLRARLHAHGGGPITIPSRPSLCVPLYPWAKRVVRASSATKRTNEAVRAVGGRDLRDRRHDVLARSAGVPLPQIQRWLGHSTIAMTMRYAHLAPGNGSELISVLDAPLRKPDANAVGGVS